MADLNKNIGKLWVIKSYEFLPKPSLLLPFDKKALKILKKRNKSKGSYFDVELLWKKASDI